MGTDKAESLCNISAKRLIDMIAPIGLFHTFLSKLSRIY